MASKRIDININSNNAGSGFKSAGSDIAKLKSEAGSAGSTIGQSISRGSQVASSSLSSLSASANKTFGTIKAGAQAARQSLGDLGTAIASVSGGLGAMEVINTMWTGAAQKQFNQAELSMKLGAQRAQEYVSMIQKVVEMTPGDDTFMGGLLSGAVAKQGNLTNQELMNLGNLTADYVVKSRSMGKALLETQMDIKEYIMSGNTGQLERDSILKGQLGTLKDQGTVSDRILALDKAMRAEGYKGLSQLDVAMIKWDLMVGKLKTAATTIGEKFLPYVEKALDWFIKLNDETNGWSSIIIVAGGAIGLLALALAPVVGATLSGYYAMKNYRIEAEKAAIANALNKGPGGAGGAGGNLGKVGTAGGLLATVGTIGLAVGTAVILSVAAWEISDVIINELDKLFYGVSSEEKKAMSDEQLRSNQVQRDLEMEKGFWDQWNAAIGTASANVGRFTSFWGGGLVYIQGAWNNTVAWLTGGANQIWAALSGAAASIGGAFSGAWNRIVGGYNWMKDTVSRWVSTGISVATGAIDWARARWNDLKNYVMNNPIVGTIRQVLGMGPAGMGAARGPGIGLHYQNYAGHKQNAWNAAGTGMSGNCVDMTLGLMSAYGGSMVSGTWNGGAHVWWQSPSGAQLDPARKALEGTWVPPARGPGGGNFGNIVINGDVYGFDDFKRKVEQANASIGYDAGMF